MTTLKELVRENCKDYCEEQEYFCDVKNYSQMYLHMKSCKTKNACKEKIFSKKVNHDDKSDRNER